jgi:hypothetical protein
MWHQQDNLRKGVRKEGNQLASFRDDCTRTHWNRVRASTAYLCTRGECRKPQRPAHGRRQAEPCCTDAAGTGRETGPVRKRHPALGGRLWQREKRLHPPLVSGVRRFIVGKGELERLETPVISEINRFCHFSINFIYGKLVGATGAELRSKARRAWINYPGEGGSRRK